MSECTHNCSTCGESCGERTSPQSFLKKPHADAHIGKVFGVVSGKGGVGKSMVTSQLAVSLRRKGYRVGILDADITGPSIPKAFGMHEKAVGTENALLPCVSSTGIEVMSINLLLDDETDPVIWRGPVIGGVVTQFWTDVLWDVDYLLVDMPPGTGDIQLTLAQNIPVTGAVVVTTPQDIALIDAKKGIVMFEKVEVPVLGIVENMSMHICSNCGHHEPIFGTGGAEKLAAKYHTQLLGQMPLHITLREDLDSGKPTVVSRPDSEFAEMYRQLAGRVAAQLYWQGEVIPGEIAFRAV